jgi:hypothetical protein
MMFTAWAFTFLAGFNQAYRSFRRECICEAFAALWGASSKQFLAFSKTGLEER